MELKRLITQVAYRIEPKPEGGFIAHPTDPTVAPLEASTREELQQKIQARVATVLAEEFPGLRLPLESKQLKATFHVERKPGGGFVIHSSDPNANPIEGATHEEVESKFAEKLIGFMGKHFVPELAEAFAAPTLAGQFNSGEIKVFVSKNTGVGLNEDLPKLGIAVQQAPASIVSTQLSDAKGQGLKFGSTADANANNAIEGVANVPIIPETSGSRTFVRLLLALLIIGALAYFLFYYSH